MPNTADIAAQAGVRVRELVMEVSRSDDPIKAACEIIGLMAGVIAFHKSEKAAAQFLRAAADTMEAQA